MRLILARHGNTFEAHEAAVWVGARTDMALTAEGRSQAEAIGRALSGARWPFDAVVTGPLRRTRETAEIIRTVAGLAVDITVDERLREIDYGMWEGRSNDEIEAAHGRAGLDAWSKNGIWPEGMDWRPGRAALVAGLRALVREFSDARAVLLVSSNGVLKHVPEAIGLVANGDLKVRTGHLSVLDVRQEPRIVVWNVGPNDL